MQWRPARSLIVLQQQLKAYAPRAAPPATRAEEWGLIGDAAHDTTSDHTPRNFAGWGLAIVTAADFPNRPDLGLDAHAVLDSIREARDPRAKYGISNGQIFSNHPVDGYEAWKWRPYNGSDQHRTHGHLSVVGDSRSDGEQQWLIAGGATHEQGDDLGASFGPIAIEREGLTSLCIPPVNAGAADPRPAWLNICNDTFGASYALRVWSTVGNETWAALNHVDGLYLLKSGQRVSIPLPVATACISIQRKAVSSLGHIVEPSAETPAYGGHLTVCIERGTR